MANADVFTGNDTELERDRLIGALNEESPFLRGAPTGAAITQQHEAWEMQRAAQQEHMARALAMERRQVRAAALEAAVRVCVGAVHQEVLAAASDFLAFLSAEDA